MDPSRTPACTQGEVVLPCVELDATTRFFVERLGFCIESIIPADDPLVAILSGAGLRLRLERQRAGAGGALGAGGAVTLRLHAAERAAVAGGALELTAPNGTRIVLAQADPELVLPPMRPAFVLTRQDGAGAPDAWKRGRAGMEYRDLIPDRLGGRYIASHIRIRDGGPVPDYVHFHKIHFQVIHFVRGWVRVAYEGQGPSLVLQAGDCLLQPPRIRHRVLECSPGLEVVEVTCPAEHETCADHALALPDSVVQRERTHAGQRFVCHRAAESTWAASWRPGLQSAETGISEATCGLAGVRVLRARGAQGKGSSSAEEIRSHDAELLFSFVLSGHAMLRVATLDRAHGAGDAVSAAGTDLGHDAAATGAVRIAPGDAFVIPAHVPHALGACSEDFELLEVALPGAFQAFACSGASS